MQQTTAKDESTTAHSPQAITFRVALFRLRLGLSRFDLRLSDQRRTEAQLHMHRLWTDATLRNTYAETASEVSTTATKRNVAITAGHLTGKSTAIAMFAAAFAWTQPKSTITVFSITQRSSVAMKDMILRKLRWIVGRDPIVNDVQESNGTRLTIRTEAGELSTVQLCTYAWPMVSTDTTVHNKIAFLDSVAYVNSEHLERIMPSPVVTGNERTSVFAITVPRADATYLTAIEGATGDAAFHIEDMHIHPRFRYQPIGLSTTTTTTTPIEGMSVDHVVHAK